METISRDESIKFHRSSSASTSRFLSNFNSSSIEKLSLFTEFFSQSCEYFLSFVSTQFYFHAMPTFSFKREQKSLLIHSDYSFCAKVVHCARCLLIIRVKHVFLFSVKLNDSKIPSSLLSLKFAHFRRMNSGDLSWKDSETFEL